MLSSTAPTGVPLNQLGLAVNSTAIIFTWDHPAIDSRNGIITGYSLLLVELTTNSTTLHSQTGAHIEVVIGNLHPYYDYECQIAAETSVGRGPYGLPFITRTLQDGELNLITLSWSIHIFDLLRSPLWSSSGCESNCD